MKRGKTNKKSGAKKPKSAMARKRPAKRRLRRSTADDGAASGPPH